jgi:hypothetical protein
MVGSMGPFYQPMLHAETGSPLSFMSLASRTAAAESLGELLEFQGIRVSSIYFGPLARCSSESSPEREHINGYVNCLLDLVVASDSSYP